MRRIHSAEALQSQVRVGDLVEPEGIPLQFILTKTIGFLFIRLRPIESGA